MKELTCGAAVNGKSVNLHDTMAGIGIIDQDTIWCHGKLRGGAQRFRQPPQDIPGQWTCSLCGQERVWGAFATGTRETMIHVLTLALTRSQVSTHPLRHQRSSSRLCPSSHRLRVLERMILFPVCSRYACRLGERLLESYFDQRRQSKVQCAIGASTKAGGTHLLSGFG